MGYQRKHKTSLFLMAGLFLCLFTWPVAQSLYAQEDEYAVKAALVYKISRFVTWPSAVAPREHGVTICVVGKSLFSDYLDALKDKVSKQVPMQTVYLSHLSKALEQCHIAFISKSESDIYVTRLKQIEHMPVLTMSDIHGFAKAGGIVEIIRRNNRLGFVFNMQKVKASGLHIAAPLLQMSTRIEEDAHE